MNTDPPPVEQDSRGILHPWLLRERVQLTRYPVGPELDGLVAMFWAVRWDVPDGMVHRQPLLTRPGANLSVGHTDANTPDYDPDYIEARCYGVVTGLMNRTIVGRGWTVGAVTTLGGLGAFHAAPAETLTDRKVPLDAVIDIDSADLVRRLAAESDIATRATILEAALAASVRPSRVNQARSVAQMAKLAETDRTMRTLADLTAATSVNPRTLQRMFREYAGVSPVWMLRRYRLLEAAESVRNGEQVRWADVAANLGYADHAHLTRDFHTATGQTPTAYAAAARASTRESS